MIAVERSSDEIFLLVFGGLTVIVLTARVTGWLFVRLRQPAVIGEVLGGIILGPSVLGLFPGDPSQLLFPPDIQSYLRIIASFGLVIYMFVIGLEINPRAVTTERRAALSISLTSVATPFILGAMLGLLVFADHSTATRTSGGISEIVDVDRLAFVLFCGLAICGSAFAILARILDDRRLFQTRIGEVLLASAVIDDIAVWLLASVVLTIAAAGSLSGIAETMIGLVLFVTALFLIIRPILNRVLRSSRPNVLGSDLFALLMIGVIAASLYTTWLGISPILGAFFFGVALPRHGTRQIFEQVTERLESVSVLILLPVFFAVTGLGVDLSSIGMDGLVLLGVFVIVATVGKVVGASIGAWFNRIRGRRAMAVGLLMNTRGLSELALLSVGRASGILDTTMFTILVCTAITTTLISGPLLSLVYPRKLIDIDIESHERSLLAETSAYRVFVLVDDTRQESPAFRLALDIAASEVGAELIPCRIELGRRQSDSGQGFMTDLATIASALEESALFNDIAEDRGVTVIPQSRIADDVDAEVVSQVRGLRPHLVVLPQDSSSELVQRLTREEMVDVVIAPDSLLAEGSVLSVETTGDLDVGLALEVAVRTCLGGSYSLRLTDDRRHRGVADLCQRLYVSTVKPAEHETGIRRVGSYPTSDRAMIGVAPDPNTTSRRTIGALRDRLTEGLGVSENGGEGL